ncbi:MAG: DUF4386 family protein [Thermoleophilia bacterium]
MPEEEPIPSATSRRTAAALIVLAVVLVNVAFIGLGSVFEYPDVLQEPAAEILSRFKDDEGAIVSLFLALAAGAALLAPIAILVGRIAGNELGRLSIWVGIVAAAVQVIGLMRWPLIVPSLADDGDVDTFDTVHTVMGTIIGETLGYLLTAAWTVLVLHALARRLAGRWFWFLGLASAVLIAVGVFVPLDLPGADMANFVGYILWSVWLLALAVLLWRRPASAAGPRMITPVMPAAH